MTSRGNKSGRSPANTSMSSVQNLVKNEFKQFLGPSIGARPMRSAANAISSSGTGKKTYKADKMTPYLFMGLQQMRTAAGRNALVESGAFNFSGPPPEKHVDVKGVATELSGNLFLAVNTSVGVSFEFGAPHIHSTVQATALDSITVTPYNHGGYMMPPSAGTPIQVYPTPSTKKNVDNLRLVSHKSTAKAGYIYFDLSLDGHGPYDIPYNYYDFEFKFKEGSLTKEEKAQLQVHKHTVRDASVFTFLPSKFFTDYPSYITHSNTPTKFGPKYSWDYDYDYKYFYTDDKQHYRVIYPHATDHNGVKVDMSYVPRTSLHTGGTKIDIKDASINNTKSDAIVVTLDGIPTADDKYHELSVWKVDLCKKVGAVSKKFMLYSDLSYTMNNLNAERNVFKKPTKVEYLDGLHNGKTVLKVKEEASSEKYLDLSFDGMIWSPNLNKVFTDLSYSMGTSTTYTQLSYTDLDLSGSFKYKPDVQAAGNTHVRVKDTLVAASYDDVNVRMVITGPTGTKLSPFAVTVVSGDILLPTSDAMVTQQMRLAPGYKLAATPGNTSTLNKVRVDFGKDNVILSDPHVTSVVVKGDNTVVTNSKSPSHANNYIDVEFNVATDVSNYEIIVDLSKNDTNTSDKDISYTFQIPSSEIFKFPSVDLTKSSFTIGGKAYSAIVGLNHTTDYEHKWALTGWKGNQSSVPRLALDKDVDDASYNQKFDISAIDISGIAYSYVKDPSLERIDDALNLSFIHKYAADASYDISYTLKHGDIEYLQYVKHMTELKKF